MPTLSRDAGTMMRAWAWALLGLLSRSEMACTVAADDEPSENDTVHATETQARPPDLLEAVGSSTRSAHEPIV